MSGGLVSVNTGSRSSSFTCYSPRTRIVFLTKMKCRNYRNNREEKQSKNGKKNSRNISSPRETRCSCSIASARLTVKKTSGNFHFHAYPLDAEEIRASCAQLLLDPASGVESLERLRRRIFVVAYVDRWRRRLFLRRFHAGQRTQQERLTGDYLLVVG